MRSADVQQDIYMLSVWPCQVRSDTAAACMLYGCLALAAGRLTLKYLHRRHSNMSRRTLLDQPNPDTFSRSICQTCE